MEVTLLEMLSCREERAKIQAQMLKEFSCPLISFTMNIAGPIKTSPLIERAFNEGLSLLLKSISEEKIREKTVRFLKTGPEAFLSVDFTASALKDICTEIEEKNAVGRLFDMDVISESGEKLERKNERGCIVCGKKGRGCAARRLHSIEELRAATDKIITRHFSESDSEKIAEQAAQSLVDEVNTTPKPGLVDRRNCGSHTDMNVDTFVKSANALKPYFRECVLIGVKTAGEAAEKTFPPLRCAGIEAEKKMYEASGGVNTHKGAVYSMGVLCGALGRLWSAETPIPQTDDILAESSRITKSAAEADFKAASGKTAGERLYLERGIKGIRGQAAQGFPAVSKIALPAFEKALSAGLDPNDAGIAALLHLIANVEDTNLYRRGGEEGALFAQNAARELLKDHPYPKTEQIEALDDEYIKRNLSPGGCADLLALTLFLYSLKNKKPSENRWS